jgi:hypothetical protein
MSWLSLLPSAIQFVLWILGRVNASEETRKKFIAFVQSAKDDGLISVQAKETFQQQKEALEKTPPENPKP